MWGQQATGTKCCAALRNLRQVSAGKVPRQTGYCVPQLAPPVWRGPSRAQHLVGSPGQADLAATLIAGQQVDRVFPQLSDVRQRLGRKAAIEKGCGPVQVLQIEGVVE